MTKNKQDLVFASGSVVPGPEHQSHPIRKTDFCIQIIVGQCQRQEILLGRAWFARQQSLAWGVLRGLWLAMGWVTRQPSEKEIFKDGLLGSDTTIATRQLIKYHHSNHHTK